MSSPPPGPARLFLALWPSSEVRDALVAATAGWPWPATARLTQPARLHATLHFLGDVPAARVAELSEALAVPGVGFDWALSVPQVWGAGIAVLAPVSVPAALVALHRQLAARLHELGLPVEERAFRPHVTLARKAQGLKAPPSIAPVAWPGVDGYRLVRTLPGGRGYESVARFDLSAPRA